MNIEILKNADQSCRVRSFMYKDGSYDTVEYPSIEAAQKINPLIASAFNGLPRPSDLCIIWFNDDGSINKIDHHNFSLTRDESPMVTVIRDAELIEVQPLVDSLKSDIITKVSTPKGETPEEPITP